MIFCQTCQNAHERFGSRQPSQLENETGLEEIKVKNTVEIMDELQNRALGDDSLKKRFLETRDSEDYLGEFCRVCRELGYEIYPMDIVQAGDEFYATMKRSTNGGGENSPVLEGEDDLYEMFFASLEQSGV